MYMCCNSWVTTVTVTVHLFLFFFPDTQLIIQFHTTFPPSSACFSSGADAAQERPLLGDDETTIKTFWIFWSSILNLNFLFMSPDLNNDTASPNAQCIILFGKSARRLLEKSSLH